MSKRLPIRHKFEQIMMTKYESTNVTYKLHLILENFDKTGSESFKITTRTPGFWYWDFGQNNSWD